MEKNIISTVWPEWIPDEKPVGAGAYGKVYRAVKNDHGITSESAVKVITISGDDPGFRAMLSDDPSEELAATAISNVVRDLVGEIRLMESFKGTQNIVSVEDYKVVERSDGSGTDVLIRMELLTPFTKYSAGRNMTEKEVIRLGVDVLSALELLNSRGVIHRDIKPQNIFVNRFGNFKLGDFGIARSLESITDGLSVKGTANYMAPEVMNSSDYDGRVDIYSLGLVLYGLMNDGRPPFVTTDEERLSPRFLNEAKQRRMNGEKLPAPKNASRAFADIILCACEFAPEDRFANPTSMKKALISIMDAEEEKYEDPDDRTVSVRRASAMPENGKPVQGAEIPSVKRKAPVPASSEKKSPDPSSSGNAANELRYIQKKTHDDIKTPVKNGGKEAGDRIGNIVGTVKKYRVPILILAAVLAMGLIAGVVAILVSKSAMNEKEPNNSYREATELPLKKNCRGNLDPKGGRTDEDWYSFELKKDGVVSINFEAPMQEQQEDYWKLTLMDGFDPDNPTWEKTVGGFDGSAVSPKISLKSGKYLIRIEQCLQTTDRYTIRVDFEKNRGNWEIENNNEPNFATEIKPGREYFGALHSKNDVDYYTFEMKENGFAKLELNTERQKGDEKNYWYYAFLPEDTYDNYIYSEWVKGTTANTVSADVSLLAGKYYIMITPSDGFSEDDYSFRLSVSAGDEKHELEPNNEAENATDIYTNREYTGFLSYKDSKYEQDWYKFVLNEDSLVTLDLSTDTLGESAEWYVSVRPAVNTGVVLYETWIRDNERSSSPRLALPEGAFCVLVKAGGNHSRAEYRLNLKTEVKPDEWELEYNDDADHAFVIEPGGEYFGTLSYKDDTDRYKFTVEQPGRIRLSFGASTSDSTRKWYVGIAPSSDPNKPYGDYAEVTGIENYVDEYNFAAGTYYFVVWNNRDTRSSEEYRFRIEYSASEFNSETEDNDSPNNANVIAIGETYSGDLRGGYNLEADWFKFELPNDAMVSFELNTDKIESDGEWWYVSLRSGQDTSRAEKTYRLRGDSGGVKSAGVPLRGGRSYYIIISSNDKYSSPSKNNYTIRVDSSSLPDNWEREDNDSFDSACTLVFGREQIGSLKTKDDEDYYIFELSEPGLVTLSFTAARQENTDPSYWYFRFYNQDRRRITYKTYRMNGSGETYNHEFALPAGTYYIEAWRADWFSEDEYRIKVTRRDFPDNWEREFNNSPSFATDIETGKEYFGQLFDENTDLEQDWFSFTLDHDATVQLSFTHDLLEGNWYWRLSLYSGSDLYHPIWDGSVSGDFTSFTLDDELILTAGTYYLRVQCDRSYTGAFYSFIISESAYTPEETPDADMNCIIDGKRYGTI